MALVFRASPDCMRTTSVGIRDSFKMVRTRPGSPERVEELDATYHLRHAKKPPVPNPTAPATIGATSGKIWTTLWDKRAPPLPEIENSSEKVPLKFVTI